MQSEDWRLHDGCLAFCGLQVTEEIENMRFNTGIAAMMEFVNAANKVRARLSKSI